MTGNVIIRHSFVIERIKKVYSVYQLEDTDLLMKSDSGKISPLLTDLIRIEKFRHYSKGSGFDEYLRLRNTNNWQQCEQVTGLFKTETPGLFYGDRLHNGRNLLIFKFSDNRNRLLIDYYLGYCPYQRGGLITPALSKILANNYE